MELQPMDQYVVVGWKNYPSTETPISGGSTGNLTKMDEAIRDTVSYANDLNSTKSDKADVDTSLGMYKDSSGALQQAVEFNSVNGTLVFHHKANTAYAPQTIQTGIQNKAEKSVVNTTLGKYNDGTTIHNPVEFNKETGVFTFWTVTGDYYTFDTGINKVVTNWSFQDDPDLPHYQCLILRLNDEEPYTYQYVDLSSIVDHNEFVATDTISVTITEVDDPTTEDPNRKNHVVSMAVKDNSITYAKLAPAARDNSQAWANGTIGLDNPVPVTPDMPQYHNNSKYYADNAKDYADNAQDAVDYIRESIVGNNFHMDSYGHLIYEADGMAYNFEVDPDNGHLMMEVL